MTIIQPNAAVERDDEMGFLAGDVNIQDLVDITNNVISPLNQGTGDAINACTIVGPLMQVGKLKNIRFTQSYMFLAINYAIKNKGYKPLSGWYTDRGTNAVVDWYNETQAKDASDYVFYLKGVYGDPLIQQALKKGHLIGFTYKGNDLYNKDYTADGILNGTSFGVATYGHRPNIFVENEAVYVLDNYYGSKNNIYKLQSIEDLIKNGVFYSTFYLILPVQAIIETPEQIYARKLKEKAHLALLYTATSTFDYVDLSISPLLPTLANALRSITGEDTSGTIDTKAIKMMINILSLGYNFVKDQKIQEEIAKLANTLRTLV